ncbi:MAG: hypothetical protein JWP51_1043 [Bradyrhizobium sp.]|jgi:hypothetical protein|nr:hypothetical protein [Bradyrhizobium sp.]
MQSSDWTAEHSEALREGLARGRSYSEIAQAINARFGTAYTRSATLGRSRRMGLASPDRSDEIPKAAPIAALPPLQEPRQRARPELVRPPPIFERASPSSFAVSKSIRAISRSWSWNAAIAATPTAGTRRVKPLPFAVTRGARVQAIAFRIFT